jgi:hypothetical protein
MAHLKELQALLDRIYGERDRKRGPERTLLWLVSEVGEVSEVPAAALYPAFALSVERIFSPSPGEATRTIALPASHTKRPVTNSVT